MNSLRLTEILIRTATPEGHDAPTDLASLRDHMRDHHGLGVAGILPLRVLLSMHEQDHDSAEPQWGGSADASRAPGFIARRH
jgi:hypothetical protein